jgi:hypothetical protein
VEGVGHLGGEALLELGTTRVAFHDPGQLREPHHLAVGYVPDVGLADHRQQMVLTGRIEGDVPDEDHLVVILLKPDGQLAGGVYVQPGEEELVGPRDPRGRFLQSFSVGVLPHGGQYLPDGPLDAGQVYTVFGRVPLFRVFEEQGSVLHSFTFLSGVPGPCLTGRAFSTVLCRGNPGKTRVGHDNISAPAALPGPPVCRGRLIEAGGRRSRTDTIRPPRRAPPGGC